MAARLIGVLLGLMLLAVLAIPVYLGYELERNVERYAADMGADGGVHIRTIDRGWFTSAVDIEIDLATVLADQPQPMAMPPLQLKGEVRHGPFLFADGLEAGWYQARLDIVDASPESAGTAGELSATILADRSLRMQGDLFPVSADAGEQAIDFAGATASVFVNRDAGYFSLSGRMPRFAVSTNGTEVLLQGLRVSYDAHGISSSRDGRLSDGQFSIDQLELTMPSGVHVEAEALSMRSVMDAVGADQIKGNTTFQLASVMAPGMAIENAKFSASLTGVSRAAIAELERLGNESSELDQQLDEMTAAEIEAFAVARISDLVQFGPTLSIDEFWFVWNGEPTEMSGEIVLQPVGDDVQTVDAAEAELYRGAQGSIRAKVAQSIVQAFLHTRTLQRVAVEQLEAGVTDLAQIQAITATTVAAEIAALQSAGILLFDGVGYQSELNIADGVVTLQDGTEIFRLPVPAPAAARPDEPESGLGLGRERLKERQCIGC